MLSVKPISENIPNEFQLYQNYPNPFNPSTEIKFSIPNDVHVNIRIYNLTGEEVLTLLDEDKTTGYYSIIFEGSNFASGVYFYKLEAGSFSDVKKMVLIK
ncbi:MAG: T9SS C-terminal target domain-containing protein [Ignavibacteriae bacterium]|nr:MAG: T9SS C-terminal target domain-containing protein [Ignavibacteriota bacterium]